MFDLDDLMLCQREIEEMKHKTYHCSNCRNEAESEFERRLASFAEDLIPQVIALLQEKGNEKYLGYGA